MRFHPFPARLAMAVSLLAALAGLGCSKKTSSVLLPNERPTIRLTNAPVDTSNSYFYAYKLNWVGFDADGRVDHFEYAVDPPTAALSETTWTLTTKNEQIVFFPSTRPESLDTLEPRGEDFHTFVIRAVDNQGLPSAPVSRSFFSYTVAPIVEIEQPRPSALLEQTVTPAVVIRWRGEDPDGQFTQKPVKYKYILLQYTEADPVVRSWIQNPDLMRQAYAPNFAGWDSCPGDTTFRQYTNLVPNTKYLFAIVAIDEAGAYSPVFSLDHNMLRLNIGYAGTLGPRIAIFNDFFFFQYAGGGFATDPGRYINIDVPADVPLRLLWFAEPPIGSAIKSYRWAMDNGDNLDDETPRANETEDLRHWSQWSINSFFTQLGIYDANHQLHGFPGYPGEEHLFFLEAQDINGLVSLGIVRFRVIRPTFDRDLLIMDDTRLTVDQKLRNVVPDSIAPPLGLWPTAAELDTFLYAKGGVRWRMTPNGTVSPPGIFKGYSYDTIGTRQGKENPTVPLDLLGRYRHIVWMVDGEGSRYAPEITYGPTHPIFPETSLRYMASPNRQNTLATWISQGGQAWMLGGGIGNATTAEFNRRGNDVGGRVYSSIGTLPDLTAGRFMFDICHWQSEFKPLGPAPRLTVKRVDQPEIPLPDGNGYPGIPLNTQPGSPPYGVLPTEMAAKSPATDPLPPLRGSTDFYVNSQGNQNGIIIEYLSQPNVQLADLDGDPETLDGPPVLDTLYVAWGPYPVMNQWGYDQSLQTNPVMTYYHGQDGRRVLFQGFDLWHFQRQQLIQLVDFVFQTMWGLPHDGSSRAPVTNTVAARRR